MAAGLSDYRDDSTWDLLWLRFVWVCFQSAFLASLMEIGSTGMGKAFALLKQNVYDPLLFDSQEAFVIKLVSGWSLSVTLHTS